MKKIVRKIKSNFLLPNIGYIVGAGSVFNLSGNYFKFNESNSSLEADMKAISSDWLNVGYDFQDAIKSNSIDEKYYQNMK